jgi:anaerobic selenocysteine-containing dehydrogenase
VTNDARGLLHRHGHRRVAARGRRGVHNNGAIYGWDKTLLEGRDVRDPSIRMLDQSPDRPRILTGDAEALRGGPPVTALLIQNTNPMNVAPEQALVREGFAREDLFTVVHEQFMTETAPWPTSSCPPRCSWSMTTSIRAAATAM